MPYKDKEKRRAYSKQYNKTYYRNRVKKDPGYFKRSNTQHREAKKIWFQEYKKTLVCSRCPENYPACLDFHHRDPATKSMIIPQMVAHGYSIKRILEEIAKCDVLCANCHRKLHNS